MKISWSVQMRRKLKWCRIKRVIANKNKRAICNKKWGQVLGADSTQWRGKTSNAIEASAPQPSSNFEVSSQEDTGELSL